MQKIIIILSWALWLASCASPESEKGVEVATEPYRPLIHFTPDSGWMNDPNGMVFHNGVYHLFYQHYPDSTIWGPMHWGHATSADMINWERQPISLYPDSLGMIFSGSAVVDKENTSGFGKDGKVPLVAIFTYHHPEKEKLGKNDHQNQGIAYSLDNGKTWTKYAGNPVLNSPGIRDFRDPKVFWHEGSSKWIMSLAAGDRIMFYSSPDLKTWQKESAFGATAGAHGGVWECPDLFSLNHNGKTVWVLIVNLNPGGPNGGSATQYFLGDFDGKSFSPYSTETKWLDYGPDNYAGITWGNTGDRKLFLGWMSNWDYANIVPTLKWRSAMTIARELGMEGEGKNLRVTSVPVKELSTNKVLAFGAEKIGIKEKTDLGSKLKAYEIPCKMDIILDAANDFTLTFSNEIGEELLVGFDKAKNQYFIDRQKAGKADFFEAFAARHNAPRFSTSNKISLTLVMDVSSIELFADNGLTVMTSTFFPSRPFSRLHMESAEGVAVEKIAGETLKSIWK